MNESKRRIAENLRDLGRDHDAPRLIELADQLESTVLGMVVNVAAFEEVKALIEKVRALKMDNAPPEHKDTRAKFNAMIDKINVKVPAAYRIEPI